MVEVAMGQREGADGVAAQRLDQSLAATFVPASTTMSPRR